MWRTRPRARARVARVTHLARERRDREVEELRRRYAPKIAALEERIRRGQERVEREQSQLGGARLDTAMSIGATVLGALFGRKLASVTNVTRARSTMRGASRATIVPSVGRITLLESLP